MTLYKIQRLPPFPSHVTQLSQLAERIQFRRVRCRVRSIGPPMPVIPEIADYEIRRELQRLGHSPGLRRLDTLAHRFLYAEITTPVMHKAAEFWADVRRRGLPTAGDQSLDADAILAAQAVLIGSIGDSVTVATGNVTHLTRFPGIDARNWTTIT